MVVKRGDLFVLAAAFIWGFCLTGQASGMDYMGPYSFSAVRLMLGAFSMIPLILVLDGRNRKLKPGFSAKKEWKGSLVPALICSPFFVLPIICQQVGLQYTGVGKCAFITTLYIFLVPLIGLFIGKKVPKKTWILVGIALVGMYLITLSSGIDNINKGDIICLGAAVTYSVQLVIVGKYGENDNVETIKFSTIQFFCASLTCWIIAAIAEPGQITWYSYSHSFIPIFVTGVISCAIGYTCQFIGVMEVEGSRASLILSSETVFSLIAGFLILHEVLKPMEYIGCLLMTVAIVINVWPEKKKTETA